MIRDKNCINIKAYAEIIEADVEDCFKKFAINVKANTSQKDDPVAKLKVAIRKENEHAKRLYVLYAENPSKNLMDVIKETEKKIEKLNKQLLTENDRKEPDNTQKIQKIKHVSDVWDTLSVKEKNRVLKECIERIVINGNDIEIRFVTF